jgi:hypothetical protein
MGGISARERIDLMIIPLIINRSSEIVFDNSLSPLDKLFYGCLAELSPNMACPVRTFLKILNIDELTYETILNKLINSGYVYVEYVKDDKGSLVYTIIGSEKVFPKYPVVRIKALKMLDSNPVFRSISFYGMSKRRLIRRQGFIGGKYFPILGTTGFNAYRTVRGVLAFLFAKKALGHFEKPEESLEELKYCGINLKTFCKTIIDLMGKVSLQLSEKTPVGSFKDLLINGSDSTKLAMSIFLESCVMLAKEADSPEQFYKIIERLSKEKARVITKKEKKQELEIVANPKLDPRYSSVIDYWNTKDLKKHKNYNSKLVVKACKVMKKLEKGMIKQIPGTYTTDDFYSAIDNLELMANDPNIRPTSLKQKQYLKKLSIDNFFYSGFNGKSVFFGIMETGSQTVTKPYSEEAFTALCKITQKITNSKLTAKNKNILAAFLNAVKLFFDKNRSRMEYEATVIKICSSILKSLTNNGKWLKYNFLISEEMRLNTILNVCLEEGYILGVKKNKDQEVFYRRSQIIKKPSPVKKVSSVVERKRELLREVKKGEHGD